jgi:hypothetical protein
MHRVLSYLQHPAQQPGVGARLWLPQLAASSLEVKADGKSNNRTSFSAQALLIFL